MTELKRAWEKIKNDILIVSLLVGSLWLVFLLDRILPFDFRSLGLIPRTGKGFFHIFTYYLVHSGWEHLAANSLALVILLFLFLQFFNRKQLAGVLIIIILSSGILYWLLGGAVIIGASGICWGLIGFLLMAGLFLRKPLLIIVSGIVFLYYFYGEIRSVFFSSGISHLGHFFGFLGGVITAWLMTGRTKEVTKNRF